MQDFGLLEMMLHGWPVLSILGIASIFSWTILADRAFMFWRSRIDAHAFVTAINNVLDKQGIPKALEYCRRSSRPIARVVAEIILQPGGRPDKERALQHALQAQIRDLQARVVVLGTIGSMAPFVGLFGTVVGIVKAFRDIAANVGGGPEVVAAGIAEALITTAAGLVVAIPAVIGYNYCVHQIEKITDEIDLAAYDVITQLTK